MISPSRAGRGRVPLRSQRGPVVVAICNADNTRCVVAEDAFDKLVCVDDAKIVGHLVAPPALLLYRAPLCVC